MSWENMSGMEVKQLVRATKSMLISCIAVCFMDRHPIKMQLSVYETLKVSRSIGDLYLKKPEFQRDPDFRGFMCPVPLKRAVITAEPSVIIRKLKPQDKFLIFASDGLWEQLTDEEAIEIVFSNPRSGIAKRLVRAELQEAANKREMRYNDLKKIETGTRRHFHDDITVVVIYLDQQNGSPSKRLAHTTSSVDLYSSDEGQLQGDQLHSATSSTITSALMADPRRKDTFFEIPEDMRATWLLGKMHG